MSAKDLEHLKANLIKEDLMDKALISLAEIISDMVRQTFQHPVVQEMLQRPAAERQGILVQYFQRMIENEQWLRNNICPI